MQRAASTDPALQRALMDAETRVQTVAQVHEHLSGNRDGSRLIDLHQFLTHLASSFRSSVPGVKLATHIDAVFVPPDRAIAIGLIANELVTNAFKYAYPAGHGTVRLTVGALAAGLFLEVLDAGVGNTAEGAAAKSTLGRKIVEALTRQLGGTTTWSNLDPGFSCRVDIPN